jgi:hypothetical protein
MYAPPDPMDKEVRTEGENARIVCLDDNDPPQMWWLAEDSTVGDWLEFGEGGGTVEPHDPTRFAAAAASANPTPE